MVLHASVIGSATGSRCSFLPSVALAKEGQYQSWNAQGSLTIKHAPTGKGGHARWRDLKRQARKKVAGQRQVQASPRGDDADDGHRGSQEGHPRLNPVKRRTGHRRPVPVMTDLPAHSPGMGALKT